MVKIERQEFVSMNSVSENVQNAALRTQYMRNIIYDVTAYVYYPVHFLSLLYLFIRLSKLLNCFHILINDFVVDRTPSSLRSKKRCS